MNTYPDGEPCRVGDKVWYNQGRNMGQVAEVQPDGLLITWGLDEAEQTVKAEDAQRLTCTEELALELLFRLLGRQLGQPLWNNPAWTLRAQKRPCGKEASVWELTLAPQNAPQQAQRYLFDRQTLRFCRPDKPCPSMPLTEPSPGARSVQADGVSYHEGDWLWECHREGFRAVLLNTIIHPADEDWQWFYELEAEEEEEGYVPGITLQTTGLDARSGSCLVPLSYIEDEWCGKLSDTERLALELLFHLLKQHPLAHMSGWDTCRDDVCLCAQPGLPCDPASYWEYQYAQWTLTLSFCSPVDAHIHAYRSFLFNRERCEFTLLPEAECDLRVKGGGLLSSAE